MARQMVCYTEPSGKSVLGTVWKRELPNCAWQVDVLSIIITLTRFNHSQCLLVKSNPAETSREIERKAFVLCPFFSDRTLALLRATTLDSHCSNLL